MRFAFAGTTYVNNSRAVSKNLNCPKGCSIAEIVGLLCELTTIFSKHRFRRRHTEWPSEKGMSSQLFREEFLEAKRNGWLGSISLVQPQRAWTLTTAAVVIAICILLFLALGAYTRRTRVLGELVPAQGLATILMPSTGVVERLSVAEGDRVTAGQVLGVIRVPRSTLKGGDTQIALEEQLARRRSSLRQAQSAHKEQLVAQGEGLRAQLAAARGELAQINIEIATRRGQIDIAKETLERLNQLLADKYVSLLQINQQKSAIIAYEGEAQALQRQAMVSQRLIAQLQQSIAELPAQRATVEADTGRDLATLDQEQVQVQADGTLVITAPVTGTVATALAKPGQAAQSGQPLISILPGNGKLEAELVVPSAAIGFIAPGNTVLLRYKAYPYQKFGHYPGRVARVSRSTLNSSELASLAGKSESGEPYYRVTVSLASQNITAYGKPESLKPGMQLEADILGERRRLIEWVFEPVYSLRGKL